MQVAGMGGCMHAGQQEAGVGVAHLFYAAHAQAYGLNGCDRHSPTL